MAITVQQIKSCDWCIAVDESVAATEERTFPHPVTDVPLTADLCPPCAFLLDVVIGRLPFIQTRMAAMDRFLTIARKPTSEAIPARVHRAIEAVNNGATDTAGQLPFHDSAEVPLDAPFVFCMECGPPQRVRIGRRSDHARAQHACQPHEILWASGSVNLIFPCTAHDVCADTGFALASEGDLSAHEATLLDAAAQLPQQSRANHKTAKKTKPKQPAQPPSNGRWVPGLNQIGCPLPHKKTGAPTPYWIRFNDRHNHADVAHHLPPGQIRWFTREGDTFTLEHRCTEHPECIGPDGQGLGFPTPESLEMHQRVVKSIMARKAQKV